MPRPLHSVLGLLSPRERKQAVLLLIVMIFVALVEVGGVASVMPFLAVLCDPSMIESQPVLQRFFAAGPFTTARGFLTALGMASFALVLFSGALRVAALFVPAIAHAVEKHRAATSRAAPRFRNRIFRRALFAVQDIHADEIERGEPQRWVHISNEWSLR